MDDGGTDAVADSQGDDGGGQDAGPATFAEVQQIFTTSCAVGSASCHNGTMGGMNGGLDLSSANAYANTVNQPSTEAVGSVRIVPGDPANSYLFLKLSNDFQQVPYCMMHAGVCGVRMPMVGGLPLTDAQLATIHDWIAQGAHQQ